MLRVTPAWLPRDGQRHAAAGVISEASPAGQVLLVRHRTSFLLAFIRD